MLGTVSINLFLSLKLIRTPNFLVLAKHLVSVWTNTNNKSFLFSKTKICNFISRALVSASDTSTYMLGHPMNNHHPLPPMTTQ